PGLNGSSDAVVVKYDAAGTLLWSRYIGGNAADTALGVCVDGSGNIYVVGKTTSTTGLASGAVHQTSKNGSEDAFLAKLTSAGGITWATYYGGSDGQTWANDCVVNSFN